jgi:periplasmic protein TonB
MVDKVLKELSPEFAKMYSKVGRLSISLARQAHIEGRVSLSCLIRTDGTIDKIEVKKGNRLLIQAATEAVSKWKFKPMMLNGKAVEMETVVNIDF